MFIKKMWRIGLREGKMILHDPRAFMFLLVVPFIVTFLFGYLFINHAVLGIRLAAVDEANTQQSRYIVRSFDESSRFDVTCTLKTEREAVTLLEADEIDGILLIPPDFSYQLDRGERAAVLIGINGSNSIVNNSSTAGAMEIIQNCSVRLAAAKLVGKGATVDMAKNKLMPVTGTMRPWFNSQYSYMNYFFLGIVAIALQQLMMLAAATGFAKEKERHTLSELVGQANRPIQAGFAKLGFYWIIAILVMAGMYSLTFRLYDIPLRGTLWNIFLLGIPFVIASLGMGMCLGLVCKNQVHAMHWTMLLTYPFYLLSGYAWPHQLMPDVLVRLSQVIPVTHIASNTRNIALMAYDFNDVEQDLRVLIVMAVFLTVLGLLIFIRQCKKEGEMETC